MAKGEKKVKKKDGVPQHIVDEILAMKPELLAVEAAREQLAIDTLKEQMAEDQQILDAQQVVDALTDSIDSEADVVQAKQQLEEAMEAHRDDEYDTAKQTLKAARHVWQVDIRDRKKKLKLMMKTIKSHINTGTLKLKP